MLQSHQRIRLEKDYSSIYRSGRKYPSRFFLLIVKPQQDKTLTSSRFGFIVSKKVGKAVVRNSVKRKLREIIRLKLPEIKVGYDCSVIAFPQSAQADYHMLAEEMESLLKKSGLVTKSND